MGQRNTPGDRQGGIEYAKSSDTAVASSRMLLLLLTTGYFILEIIINIMVFKQLSIKSDFFTIETMEFWGKIITGLGASLLLVRWCYFNHILIHGQKTNRLILYSFFYQFA